MADFGNIALGLQGFGAGVQGQLPQFQASLAGRRKETQALDDRRKKALAQDALGAQQLLSQGDIQGTMNLIGNRLQGIEQLGGDPSDTMALLQKIQGGDIEGAQSDLGLVVNRARAVGVLPQPEKGAGFTLGEGQTRFDAAGNVIASGAPKSQDGRSTLAQVQSSQILPNGSTVQVFKDGSTRVTGTEGEVLKGADRAQAIIDAQEFGVDIQSRRAGGREGATGTEKRASDLITRGISAAESTATLRRAITLMDSVKTGGIAAISIATRQRLGIEGADEGELSNSLGKAVLSQLRETFGAAFTESEGARLIRLEAAIGKSPESNRRILSQALRIAERTSNRAISAAKSRGNMAEVADIEELLSFSLDIEDLPAGLPTGTVDNGDGTFTLANGDVVRRK